MFIRISGNLFEDSGECYYFKIPGNVEEDSGECSKRFWGMFRKIPGNVRKDSGECLRKFQETLEKIPGNVREGSGESNFRFILWNLAYFLSNSAIKLRQNKRIFPTLLLTTYNQSPTFKYCFSFTFFLSFPCRGKNVITVRRCRGIKKL